MTTAEATDLAATTLNTTDVAKVRPTEAEADVLHSATHFHINAFHADEVDRVFFVDVKSAVQLEVCAGKRGWVGRRGGFAREGHSGRARHSQTLPEVA